MMLLKSLVILAFCVTVTHAIHCFTCENESCGRANGYTPEDCGDHVNKCYTLKNFNQQIYRVGCLPLSCNEIKKQGDQCTPCDSNNCNGIAMAAPPIGSGTQYNSAITLSSLNVILFAIVLSFVATFFNA